MFEVLQEAVSTGDPELVQLVLQYREYKRATERLAGIPELLSKLRQVCALRVCFFLDPRAPVSSMITFNSWSCFLLLQARDFYVEMKWEFTSWGESPPTDFNQPPLTHTPAPIAF